MISEKGHRAKKLVLQCINGLSSNPVEGRTQICQLKDLIITVLDLMFRRICIYKRLKSSQRMNLRNVGSETSVNDPVQTNKNDK